MKRYIKSFTTDQLKQQLGDNYPEGGYLYIFKHGIGPGTIPRDVQIVKTKDLPNYYTAVWLDRFLTTSELKEYDIPDETRINELLGRIGYCQKNGDVVPCNEVEASTKITSDSHIWESEDFDWEDYGSSESYGGFESPEDFENWYYGTSPDDKYFTIQLYLKDGSEHWCEKLEPSPEDAIYSLYHKKINLIKSDASDYDYAVWSGRMCDGQECNPSDALYFKKVSDDVEACGKVTASTRPHPSIPAGWERVSEGDDDEGNWSTISKELPNNGGYIWLDMYYDDNDRRYYELQIGYRNSDGTIGDIHPLISKEFYRLGDAVKYAEDRINRDSLVEDIESCDNVMASEICYRDRDNDDRVVALDAGMSDEDVEEMLAAHPSYYRSTLDRFEACDRVEATTEPKYFANMVNASDELDTDPIYSIEAYYSANGGLAASEDTSDFSKMLDYICDYANQGSWIRVQNNMSGECCLYSSDEWLEAIGNGEYPISIYELQEDRSEGV